MPSGVGMGRGRGRGGGGGRGRGGERAISRSNSSIASEQAAGAHVGEKRKLDDGVDSASDRWKATKEKRREDHVLSAALSSLSAQSAAEEAAEAAAWIAERKAKFPTRAALLEKEKERLLAIERGEVPADDHKRRGGRGGRGGRGFAERSGRGRTLSTTTHERAMQGVQRNGDRSDIEDEPSDDEFTSAASVNAVSATAGTAALPAGSPMPEGQNPSTWKRRLCRFEQPGQRGCSRSAANCSYLHRGEVPPPRQPWGNRTANTHAHQAGNAHSDNSPRHTNVEMASPSAKIQPCTLAENYIDASLPTKRDSVTFLAQHNDLPPAITTTPPLPHTASTSGLCSLKNVTPLTAEDLPFACAPVKADSPLPLPSLPALSLIETARLLQAIQFLVQSGPLRLQVQEPNDECLS